MRPINADLLARVLGRALVDRQPVALATGCTFRGGKRLVLDIDDETFGQVQDYARRSRVSVSSAVRELVEFGLEEVR